MVCSLKSGHRFSSCTVVSGCIEEESHDDEEKGGLLEVDSRRH